MRLMAAVPDYSHIQSCLSVGDDTIAEALASARSMNEPSPRKKMLALVERMAEVATPNRGAAKILIVLAHMASRDWLDGNLFVRLIGDHELAVLELLVNDGVTTQRLLGPVRIDVPFAEFRRALQLKPEMVLPLQVDGEVEERRVELRSSARTRKDSMPPSLSALSDGLVPFLSGSGRKLPEIISQAPASKERPPLRAARPVQPPAMRPTRPSRPPAPSRPPPPMRPQVASEGEPRRFKAISLPPHMRAALEPLKKK